MTPTIRIDDDVFEKLKEHAEPFVDTPNSVLRRILDLAPGGATNEAEGTRSGARASGRRRVSASAASSKSRPRRRQPRAKAGTTLPDAEYEIPILEVLRDSN